MHHIGYLSTAAFNFSEADLNGILEKSRRNNTKLGITGILLYSEESILQILEGEKELIETLFNKISKDFRHVGVTKVLEGELPSRNFPDWSMGFKKLSPEESLMLDGYFKPSENKQINQKVDGLSPSAFIFLKSFYIAGT